MEESRQEDYDLTEEVEQFKNFLRKKYEMDKEKSSGGAVVVNRLWLLIRFLRKGNAVMWRRSPLMRVTSWEIWNGRMWIRSLV